MIKDLKVITQLLPKPHIIVWHGNSKPTRETTARRSATLVGRASKEVRAAERLPCWRRAFVIPPALRR